MNIDPDSSVSLGCAGVLIASILACVVTAFVHDVMRPTDVEILRACSDACGPGRLGSYDRLSGCVCADGAR